MTAALFDDMFDSIYVKSSDTTVAGATDVKLLTVSTPYDVLDTDYIIHCSGDTVHNITMPALGNILARELTVKDSSFNAGTYNKTITQAGGKVEGHSSGYTMNTDGGSITFYCYGDDLFIKSKFFGSLTKGALL